ncbi:hypothetical protein [Nonomuraea longispora]|nr:hypothetical protein [Nonomuraea longispora]
MSGSPRGHLPALRRHGDGGHGPGEAQGPGTMLLGASGLPAAGGIG